jgi:hypothetical protein
MKQTLIIFTFLFLGISVFGQKTKKEVDNGIFVVFPDTPEYNATKEASTYITTTENCIFLVTIQRNVIPNYVEFAKAEKTWTETQKKQIRDTLLDNVVKGKLAYTGNKGQVSEIKIGNYYGRKLAYSAINPATGERGKRFSVILSVRDKILNFDCWFLQDNDDAVSEKNSFINSINTY